MRIKKTNLMVVSFFTAVFCLAGCGGGGGGSDSSPNVSSYYKGNTTQATVTVSNAEALSVDAIEDLQNISTAGVLGKSVVKTAETNFQMLQLADIIKGSIANIYVKTTAKTVAVPVQTTEYGISGSYSISADANQSTGAMSGTITFNSYVEKSDSPTISGTVTFSALINISTDELINADMTLSNLLIVDSSQSSTLNGTMQLTTNTLNLSIVRLDNTSNNTYWHKDFSIGLNGNAMMISGTYYDHVYGYVAVTTGTSLIVTEYSDTPTSGQLLFTGSNGTKARLTYIVSGYTLEVDASGNDTYVPIQ